MNFFSNYESSTRSIHDRAARSHRDLCARLVLSPNTAINNNTDRLRDLGAAIATKGKQYKATESLDAHAYTEWETWQFDGCYTLLVHEIIPTAARFVRKIET